MTRPAAACLLLAGLLIAPTGARAYCRTTSPPWTDATPVRIVLHSSMDDEMRHPFGNDLVPCSTSAECGTGGACLGPAGASRCVGPVWSRTELVRTVRWVVSRINASVGGDVPFVYFDEFDAPTCPWLDDCHDLAGPPWTTCFEPNTIVIVPSNCDDAHTTWIGGSTDIYSRQAIVVLQRSTYFDSVPLRGIRRSHAPLGGTPLEPTLLHEIGHALGLGHVTNDYPSLYPTCTPLYPGWVLPHPLWVRLSWSGGSPSRFRSLDPAEVRLARG